MKKEKKVYYIVGKSQLGSSHTCEVGGGAKLDQDSVQTVTRKSGVKHRVDQLITLGRELEGANKFLSTGGILSEGGGLELNQGKQQQQRRPEGDGQAMDSGKQGLEKRRGCLLKVLPNGSQNRKLGDVRLHKLEKKLADISDRRKAERAPEGVSFLCIETKHRLKSGWGEEIARCQRAELVNNS